MPLARDHDVAVKLSGTCAGVDVSSLSIEAALYVADSRSEPISGNIGRKGRTCNLTSARIDWSASVPSAFDISLVSDSNARVSNERYGGNVPRDFVAARIAESASEKVVYLHETSV